MSETTPLLCVLEPQQVQVPEGTPFNETKHQYTSADITQGDPDSSIYLHRNECIRRRNNERVKGHDRRVGIVLERPDHLHLVPSTWKTISDAQ